MSRPPKSAGGTVGHGAVASSKHLTLASSIHHSDPAWEVTATGSGCTVRAKTLSHLVNYRQVAPTAAELRTGGDVTGSI